MNLDEIKNMLEENGFNLWGVTGSTQNGATEELEKDKFTEEEFEKACEDLGLEDSGEESDDVDDFFQRLNQV
jgi:hypothetical protein